MNETTIGVGTSVVEKIDANFLTFRGSCIVFLVFVMAFVLVLASWHCNEDRDGYEEGPNTDIEIVSIETEL